MFATCIYELELFELVTKAIASSRVFPTSGKSNELYVGNDRNLKLGNKGIQTYKCKCWIEEVLTYNVLHYSKKTEQVISTSWKINKILAFL